MAPGSNGIRVAAKEEVAASRTARADGIPDLEGGEPLEHDHGGSAPLQLRQRVRVDGVVIANAIECAVAHNRAPAGGPTARHAPCGGTRLRREGGYLGPRGKLTDLRVCIQLLVHGLWPHLHHLNGELRAADLRESRIEVVEAHVGATQDKRPAGNAVDKAISQLNVCEVGIPQL